MESHIDKKFYVPDISEFHIGFEFEEWTYTGNRNWTQKIFNETNFESISLKLNKGKIRVKTLNREDIESLGFEYSGNNMVFDKFNSDKETPNGKYSIFIHSDILSIQAKSKTGAFTTEMFNGYIKNKSELKRVLKQIGYERG